MQPLKVYRTLLKSFGPQGWWPVSSGKGRSAYRPGYWGKLTERQKVEVCAGAILTQNANWTNAARAVESLAASDLLTLERIERARPSRIERLIKPSGYYRQKTLKLKAFARRALTRGGRLGPWLSAPLPALREELLGLFGVGPETADSILLYAGRRPAFVIDAYTIRIGTRVGWFRDTDYHTAQRFLTECLPVSTKIYGEFHALLVELAKRHCRKRVPLCADCPLARSCSKRKI